MSGPPTTGPLAGLRVIAVEQYGAGPYGSMQLADLGAEVIKIEDPAAGGDVSRYVPPFQEGEHSLFFETFNRNKKSLSLDLRHQDARGHVEVVGRCEDSTLIIRGRREPFVGRPDHRAAVLDASHQRHPGMERVD